MEVSKKLEVDDHNKIFSLCHCFRTDFVCVTVSGRILFVSLFRDGFWFCCCFRTDFVFVIVSGRILFFLLLFRDGFCVWQCLGTDFVFGIAWGRILFVKLFQDEFCFCHGFGTDPTSDWTREKCV